MAPAPNVSVPILLPPSFASPILPSSSLESDPILPESFGEMSLGNLLVSTKLDSRNPKSEGPSSQQGSVCPDLKGSADSPKLNKPNPNTAPKPMRSEGPTSQTTVGGPVPSPPFSLAAVPLNLPLINQNVEDPLPVIRPSGGRGFGNWGDHRHRSYQPESYGCHGYVTYDGRRVHNTAQLHRGPLPPIFRPPPPPTAPLVRPYVNPMGFPIPNAPPPVYLFRPPSEINRCIAPPPLPFAIPLPRVFPQVDLLSIRRQVEYYFSKENLCRDEHLRMSMDEQGWVPVELIAGFNRVKKLTEGLIDNIPCVLDVLRSSVVVEVQGNKLRKRSDWHKWIIPSSYLADVHNRGLCGNASGGS